MYKWTMFKYYILVCKEVHKGKWQLHSVIYQDWLGN